MAKKYIQRKNAKLHHKTAWKQGCIDLRYWKKATHITIFQLLLRTTRRWASAKTPLIRRRVDTQNCTSSRRNSWFSLWAKVQPLARGGRRSLARIFHISSVRTPAQPPTTSRRGATFWLTWNTQLILQQCDQRCHRGTSRKQPHPPGLETPHGKPPRLDITLSPRSSSQSETHRHAYPQRRARCALLYVDGYFSIDKHALCGLRLNHVWTWANAVTWTLGFTASRASRGGRERRLFVDSTENCNFHGSWLSSPVRSNTSFTSPGTRRTCKLVTWFARGGKQDVEPFFQWGIQHGKSKKKKKI